jgi:hypothetical protein
MNVNVHNGASITRQFIIRNRVQGSGGDIVENAKAARFSSFQETVDACMMARWTDKTECIAISSDEDAVMKKRGGKHS